MLYRIFTLLILLLAAPAWGADYYVDCNASAGGDGSLSTPWDALADVNGASFSAGDNIYLASGCTFSEQLIPPSSGSSGNLIWFYPYGTGANPIISYASDTAIVNTKNFVGFSNIDFTSNCAGCAAAWIEGSNNRIEDCIGRATGGGWAVYLVLETSDSNTILRGTYSAAANAWSTPVIKIYAGSDNVIDGVRIGVTAATAKNGIGVHLVEGGTGNIIRNSFFGENQSTAPMWGVWNQDTNGTKIYSNSFKYCEYTGFDNGGGVYIAGSSGETQTYHNYFGYNNLAWYENSSSSSSGNNIAVFNVAELNLVNGFVTSNALTTGAAPLIAHNTIYHHTSTGVGHALSVENGTNAKAKFYNNICVADHLGSNEQCIMLYGSYSNVELSNNIYHVTNGAILGYIGDGEGGTSYNTLTEWQTALESNANVAVKDTASVQTNPQLNAAYEIGNTAVRNTAAVLYAYAAHPGDYYGRKIYGAGPDIGAVEFEDVSPGSWFFEFFSPPILNLCASTNAACYTQLDEKYLIIVGEYVAIAGEHVDIH